MYSISAASRLSGVGVDTIRKWEQRYGKPVPGRSAGGHRSYSPDDVALLRAMKTLVDDGIRPGALKARAPEDIVSAARDVAQPQALGDEASSASLVDEVLAAAVELDTWAAEAALSRPLLAHPPSVVAQRVYLPLLAEVGDRWHAGEIDVATEHFVERMVTARITAGLVAHPRGARGVALCACTPGERHEAGLLAAALALQDLGFGLIYLGADLPVSSLVRAVQQRRPEIVALAATMPVPPSVRDELREASNLRAFQKARVLLGGAAAAELHHALGLGQVCARVEDISSIVGAPP